MLIQLLPHIYRYLKKLLHGIDYCLPNQCLLCHCVSGVDLVCNDCYAELPSIKHACQRCGVDLTVNALICGECLLRPPIFQCSRIPFFYQTDMAFLIKQLKFQHKLVVARFLAETFARRFDFLKNSPDLPQCLIPVPLHPTRLRQRGFNQALEIARILSKKWQIPIVTDLCVRERDTPAQSSLPAEERLRNVKNAFSLRKKYRFQRVAIFDDVITTGYTVNEVARVLHNSGIEMIEVWGMARTAVK